MAEWLTAIRKVFDSMRQDGPSRLLRNLEFQAEELGLEKTGGTAAIRSALGDRDSEIREELHNRLAGWDFAGNAEWSKTERNTRERRDEIYQLLQLPEELATDIERALPPRTNDIEQDMVIKEGASTDWYTADFRREREFYWPAFRGYLEKQKGWPAHTLNALSESADRIIENLAPPHSETPMPKRGLVVGYVQSGKTTNFTAVAAKAIDAGYRLIIILGGTLDILRKQTQRRLDMELIGVENLNIIEGDVEREYADDNDYPFKFVSFGQIPPGRPHIKRMTTSIDDFARSNSSQALAFDELRDTPRAYTLDAIKKSHVRFFVIKKTVKRLGDLVRELKHNEKIREHIPALIIDDESDQASVNTVDPATEKERSATNRLIVEMLALLPRSQYVGYTATPFANVLVDPACEEDIFPRDFIISLPRPDGYMGVRDFNDMDAGEGDPTPNKDAHVRLFEANDETSLDRAMDAFVVSGALKLFRKDHNAKGDFKHHTMMIHEQVQNIEQTTRRNEVFKRWKSSGYSAPGPGQARLRNALEQEFRPTWERLNKELPFPRVYEQLKPFVGEALKRINPTDPIIIVNGADDGVDPKFDKESVWKIIIGGAKLSRGFTVEGLTITHFGRRAAQQDTLMQMGRWFGYRAGYRDLVRLFLQKADGTKFDIYAAFEALCRDEESFREQLTRYSKPPPGQKAIRPIEVPAVVFSSFPKLTPTARNKMFSAQLVQDYLSDGWKYPVDVSLLDADREKNWELLIGLSSSLREVDIDDHQWLSAELSRNAACDFLDALRWKDGQRLLAPEINFFKTNGMASDKWALVLPQLESRPKSLGKLKVSVHQRSLQPEGGFKAFTDPTHVKLAGTASRANSGPLSGRALLLVYPSLIKAKDGKPDQDEPIVGLAVYHPPIAREHQVTRFSAVASSVTVPRASPAPRVSVPRAKGRK